MHNLALLCGPPGSGKTTLAKALAQKLAIRLSRVYSTAKLISVNSPSLLSSYFGESSKLVGKLFDTIWAMSADESLLTVVVIDEVESIAGSRKQASRSNECGDAIRVSMRGMPMHTPATAWLQLSYPNPSLSLTEPLFRPTGHYIPPIQRPILEDQNLLTSSLILPPTDEV